MPATFEEFQAELAKRESGAAAEKVEPGVTQGMQPAIDPVAMATGAGLVGGLGGALNTNMAASAEPSSFTPSNIVHHGIPILLQMLGTKLGGAGGGLLAKMLGGGETALPAAGQMLGSGAGSAAGYGYQSAVEPAVQGQPITATPSGALANFGIGAAMEGGVQGAGAINRRALGKTAALAGADKAEAELMKHSATAFEGFKDAEVEQAVREGLGPKAVIPEPVALDTLTAATTPVKNLSREAVGSVFKGVSDKFDATLEPYRDLPIPDSSLASAAKILRDNISMSKSGETLSPAMSKLMDAASNELTTGGKPVAVSIGREPVRFGSYATTGAERSNLAQILSSKIPGGAGGIAEPPTVNQMLGLRNQFGEIVRGGGKPVDRRTAFSMIDAIDSDIGKVMPPEAQADLTQHRAEWLQARSTFSGAFQSRLFHADGPEQVAEAIYNGAKTGKAMGNRAALLVNQVEKESPDQLPTLRQAFTSMIANRPDATQEVLNMDPRVMRVLYRGTGFEDPKAWVEARRAQITLQNIGKDPAQLARWNSYYQTGLGSFGDKVKADAMAEAENVVNNVPVQAKNWTQALADAKQAGALKAADPMGGGFMHYLQHRMIFHAALGIGAMGASHTTPDLINFPTMLLGSAMGMSAALANPTLGRLYYNAVTSKTIEQMAFWAGRLTAAGLTERVRPKQ